MGAKGSRTSGLLVVSQAGEIGAEVESNLGGNTITCTPVMSSSLGGSAAGNSFTSTGNGLTNSQTVSTFPNRNKLIPASLS